jgi:hypothetical protein
LSRRDGNKAQNRGKHDDGWTRELMRELREERKKRPLYLIAVKRDGERAGAGVERYVDDQLTWFASLYWAGGQASLDTIYRQAILKAVERDGVVDVIVPLRWLDNLATEGAHIKRGHKQQFDRVFDLARDALKRKTSIEEVVT